MKMLVLWFKLLFIDDMVVVKMLLISRLIMLVGMVSMYMVRKVFLVGLLRLGKMVWRLGWVMVVVIGGRN